MDALISIHPEFVEDILSGKKRYEFRKRSFLKPIERIYIYSTCPQKKIIGYFLWMGHIEGNLYDVWHQTEDYAAISKKKYMQYFHGYDRAYAIIISELYIFHQEINPWVYEGFSPPQSYCYLKGTKGGLYEQLRDLVSKDRVQRGNSLWGKKDGGTHQPLGKQYL